MPNKFSSGKYAIAECDRCGQRYKLKQLRKLTIKTKQVSIKVCPECWEPDQPQLQLGMYPVNDPQAVREPRPDTSYWVSGQSGLQIDNNGGTSEDGFGYPEMGSRIFQWGWNPVGGSRQEANFSTPDDLKAYPAIGNVSIIEGQGCEAPVFLDPAYGYIGNVEVIAEANVLPTGVSGTVQIGDEVVTADANVLPSGVQATTSLNDVEPVCECVVDAFGVEANVGLGEEQIIAEANVNLGYVVGIGQIGTVSYILDCIFDVTGVTGTTTVGNESVIEGTGISFNVTGNVSTGSIGTVSVVNYSNIALSVGTQSAAGCYSAQGGFSVDIVNSVTTLTMGVWPTDPPNCQTCSWQWLQIAGKGANGLSNTTSSNIYRAATNTRPYWSYTQTLNLDAIPVGTTVYTRVENWPYTLVSYTYAVTKTASNSISIVPYPSAWGTGDTGTSISVSNWWNNVNAISPIVLSW